MVVKNNQIWWEDHSCNKPYAQHNMVAPLCQRDTSADENQTTTEEPKTTTDFLCPDNWVEFNQSCYRQFDYRTTTWYGSQTMVLPRGLMLMMIAS